MNEIYLKDKNGQAFPINASVLKIGRALDNDIVLSDMSVSRYHVALQPQSDGLLVSNTGSDSGFYLNDHWILDNAVAQSGDVLRIGFEEFMVSMDEVAKVQEFNFDTDQDLSRSVNLNVNSRTKTIRIFAVLIILMMLGSLMLPEENTQNKERKPASEAKSIPTQGLPEESYTDANIERKGPQEVTADDIYKQGLRELSTGNTIRAIQYFQQSLVEDPSLAKARDTLAEAEIQLKKKIESLVVDAEKNYSDGRLALSRSQANQSLDLMSEQIPGFSFQVQQQQRSLATQRLPIYSREMIYLDMPCKQAPNENLCTRSVEILKRARLKLGEENILK